MSRPAFLRALILYFIMHERLTHLYIYIRERRWDGCVGPRDFSSCCCCATEGIIFLGARLWFRRAMDFIPYVLHTQRDLQGPSVCNDIQKYAIGSCVCVFVRHKNAQRWDSYNVCRAPIVCNSSAFWLMAMMKGSVLHYSLSSYNGSDAFIPKSLSRNKACSSSSLAYFV